MTCSLNAGTMTIRLKRIFSGACFRILLLLAALCLASYTLVVTCLAAENNLKQASTVQVYFYPKTGQPPEQQDRDRYECYHWAVSQTGFDPNTSPLPIPERMAVVPTPPPGQGTVVGAVAGAFIGALAGGPHHALQGAVIGGGTGALVGAASDSARQAEAARAEEAYARRDQARNDQITMRAHDFRRAMSACLEGRGYTVK